MEKFSAPILLETDSLILVQIINGEVRCPSKVWCIYYQGIRKTMEIAEVKALHISRERNAVADDIVNWSIMGQKRHFF